MTIIPASIRNLLARRKPTPPRCTPDNINALMGRIIRHENNSAPGMLGADWISHELRRAGDPTPDDIARRGEGGEV